MSTLTIRLPDGAREQLEAEAARRGVGLSTLVPELAEAEARRVEHERVMADWEPVLAHIADDPGARDELDMYGTPVADIFVDPATPRR
ncbi:MAG: CopG family transcriptional regulator [Acidobacteriota bacterium]|nr:CopG family transcriptional regulator [Acidobacteriota bacterium]